MNLRRRRHKLQAREVGMNLIRRGFKTESSKKKSVSDENFTCVAMIVSDEMAKILMQIYS